MNHQEIISAIESLPRDSQIAIINTVLNRLTSDGPLPVSEELKAEFLRREQAFFANPKQGKPWEQVRAELFEQ